MVSLITRPRIFPSLKESEVMRLCPNSTFVTATRLYQSGAILNRTVVMQEATLLATVRDDLQLYELKLQHSAGDEFVAHCDCGRGGLCVHACALLLTWAKESYTFAASSPLGDISTPSAYVASLAPTPAAPPNPWHEHLKWHNVSQLRAIAKRHQFKLKGNDRAGFLAQIAGLLSDPETHRRALKQLSETERAVLHIMFILSDGQPDVRASDLPQALGRAQDAEALLLELGEWGLVVSDASQGNRFTPYTLAPHVSAALISATTTRVAVQAVKHTSDLREATPPFDAHHPVSFVAELAFTPTNPRTQHDTTLWDIEPRLRAKDLAPHILRVIEPTHALPEIVWLARHLKLRLRPQPIESKQTLDALRHWPLVTSELVNLQLRPGWLHRVDSVLTIPPQPLHYDDKSLDALRTLTGSDLLSEFVSHLLAPASVNYAGTTNSQQPTSNPASSKEDVSPMTNYPQRSSASPLPIANAQPPTAYQLFAQWQHLHSWTELWLAQHLGLVNVRRTLQNWRLRFNEWLAILARARRFVTRILTLLAGETWYDFEALLKFIYELRPDFLRERPLAPNLQPLWWLEVNGKKVDPQNYAEWRESYGAFISEIIRGPLHWLGAVTLAVQPTSNALVAFRLTPLGAALLHGQPQSAVAHTQRALVSVGEDLRVRVPLGQQNLKAYQTLERFACFERIADQHAIYQFNARQALAAFESGLSADDILAQLGQLVQLQDNDGAHAENGMAQQPLPAAVRHQWRTWWAHYAQVRWYDDLTLVEFADDYALQELLAQTDLRDHLLFTFSPRLIALQPDTADAFVRQLIKKGHTPKIE
jgi:hypothetical protein